MKHNIKTVNGERTTTNTGPTRALGLRLPNAEFADFQKEAREQDRSLSSLARICLRLGLKQLQKQKADEA